MNENARLLQTKVEAFYEEVFGIGPKIGLRETIGRFDERFSNLLENVTQFQMMIDRRSQASEERFKRFSETFEERFRTFEALSDEQFRRFSDDLKLEINEKLLESNQQLRSYFDLRLQNMGDVFGARLDTGLDMLSKKFDQTVSNEVVDLKGRIRGVGRVIIAIVGAGALISVLLTYCRPPAQPQNSASVQARLLR